MSSSLEYCYQEGCIMWSFIKSMLWRLSVNMCVCLFGWFMVFMAVNITFDYAQRMLWWLVVSLILYVIGGVVYFKPCDVAFHLAF